MYHRTLSTTIKFQSFQVASIMESTSIRGTIFMANISFTLIEIFLKIFISFKIRNNQAFQALYRNFNKLYT